MERNADSNTVQVELALERTRLSNRRTLLAYMRSFVALIVAGAGLLKFIQSPAWVIIGWACIIVSPVVMIYGVIDFKKVASLIDREEKLLFPDKS